MIRFISTLIVTFLVSISAQAQVEMGKIHLSGSSDLTFSSQKMSMQIDGETVGDEVSNSNFNFNPSLGYFFADGFAMGLSVSYESSTLEDVNTTTFLAGPYAMVYIGQANVKPFLRADVLFGNSKEDDFDAKAFGWDLGGGVAAFINNTVAFEFGLAYVYGDISNPDDSDQKIVSKGVGVNAGLSLFF
ncbi:porin family protein [Labilibacter sediminis]|nr:porin family protein [Labilibacter sediminis]